jgi:hypothetical protein
MKQVTGGINRSGGIIMVEPAKVIAFLLLIVGTAGLLVNEFVFYWGRVATLVFAVLNVIGLIILGMTGLRRKED